MAALTPEEHNKILDLQAELKSALAIWSSSDPRDANFDQLILFVDVLVNTNQQILDRHATARKAVLSRVGGGISLVVAVAVSVAVLVVGWPEWLFAVSIAGLLVGIYLLVVGGKRARIT